MRTKKEKEYIKINNVMFEKKGNVCRHYAYNLRYEDLYNCYARPSQTKCSIYYDWKNEFLDSVDYDLIIYGISGYNCNMFSLSAIVENKETKKQYYIYITKTRNEISEIVD